MSEPFLAEVRMVGFGYPPKGWALCDGQVLPIAQNQALFSVLGTTYGGDGRTSFALPDLRGRTPIHAGGATGTNRRLGEKGGQETVTLAVADTPSHKHTAQASAANADAATSSNTVLAAAGSAYRDASNLTGLRSGTIGNTGGGQAHNNLQPFLTLNFCIALHGEFPQRT